MKRTLEIGAILLVGGFLVFLAFPKYSVDKEESVIKAQESQARALADAESRFFRKHSRFTLAADSLELEGRYAGMGIDVRLADSATFRARIITLSSTRTIQLALDVVDGTPRTSELSRVPQSPDDVAWWERTYHIVANPGAHGDTTSNR